MTYTREDLFNAAENDDISTILDAWVDDFDIDTRADDGHTALHYAAKAGAKNAVITLLKLGCEVSPQTLKGNTPLHGAAYKGKRDVVLTLLNARADKNIKNQDGETPLDRARKYGQHEVVEVLK